MSLTLDGNGVIGGAVLRDVPAFIASHSAVGAGSGVISITGSTLFTPIFAVEQLDTHNWYNAVSAYTPQIAGWYEFEINALLGNSGTGLGYASLLKNGVEVARGGQATLSAQGHVACRKMIYCNGTTDSVSYGLYTNLSSPSFYRSGEYSYFQGKLIRSGP